MDIEKLLASLIPDREECLAKVASQGADRCHGGVAHWSMPSTYEYVPNSLFRVTLCLYLFVTALALATGRPTLPRVLPRRPIFQG